MKFGEEFGLDTGNSQFDGQMLQCSTQTGGSLFCFRFLLPQPDEKLIKISERLVSF